MTNRAGTVAQPSDLVDLGKLLDAYTDVVPDPSDPDQRVAFGTSGHRGSSLTAAPWPGRSRRHRHLHRAGKAAMPPSLPTPRV